MGLIGLTNISPDGARAVIESDPDGSRGGEYLNMILSIRKPEAELVSNTYKLGPSLGRGTDNGSETEPRNGAENQSTHHRIIEFSSVYVFLRYDTNCINASPR